MANSFFNNVISLIAGTKARASTAEAKFTAVAAGFDGVETAINLKAPIASPAFTGVPTAPTAGFGTANGQIATTQFVANAAFTSVLPGQSGNNGKFLKTDGLTASWQSLAPAWSSITATPNTLGGYGINMTAARAELGASTVGNAVFTAADAAAARTAIGASSVGSNVLTSVDQTAARLAIGATSVGSDLLTASDANAARSVLGVQVNPPAAPSFFGLYLGNAESDLRLDSSTRTNNGIVDTSSFDVANYPSWVMGDGFTFSIVNNNLVMALQ